MEGQKTDLVNNENEKDSLSCILNPNTAINNVTRENIIKDNCLQPIQGSNPNKVIYVVSSPNEFIQSSASGHRSTIVLNYNPNSLASEAECFLPLRLKLPVNLPHMQFPNLQMLHQKKLSPYASTTTHSYRQPILNEQSHSSQKGPIKVVDMKKLLQPLPKESALSSKSSEDQDCKIIEHVIHKREKVPEKSVVGSKINPQNECATPNKVNVVEHTSKVTVSQVLDCLKVILPAKFDMSRLIPNDKVAALVIRYLKLEDDIATKNIIFMYLRIIVEAAKAKEQNFGSEAFHPYWKINNLALQLALQKVLPPTFHMSDVSNLVLNCLCLVLNQDVYIDGYHILRKLIRKPVNIQQPKETNKEESNTVSFTNEKTICYSQKGKSSRKKFKSSDSETQSSKKLSSEIHAAKKLSYEKGRSNSTLEPKKGNLKTSRATTENKSSSLADANEQVKIDLHFSRNVEGIRKKQDSKAPLIDSLDYENSVSIPSISNNEMFENPKSNAKGKMKEKFESITKQTLDNKNSDWNDPENIQAIYNFLEMQECSAKDVLHSFRGMFYLCRFLHVKSKHTNIQKLRESLSWIDKMSKQKKCSKNVLEEHLSSKKKSPKKAMTNEDTGFKSSLKNQKYSNKLKQRPVVVLQDLIDFEIEDLMFMKHDEKVYSGEYKQCVSNDMPSSSSKMYLSDAVKKLTCDSYKQFRRIVAKKVGKRVIFCLKYSKLAPGTLVFVKDFQNPILGWLKGKVREMESSLVYVVQLDSGEIWRCGPEQLRPLPDTETAETEQPDYKLSSRRNRIIKPKQLFDL